MVYVCIIHSATFVIIPIELPVNTSVISANHVAATPGIKAGRHGQDDLLKLTVVGGRQALPGFSPNRLWGSQRMVQK